MKEIRDIIDAEIPGHKLKAFTTVFNVHAKNRIKYWFYALSILSIVFLFLPWTQNIRSRGTVTTLRQENRPQELNSVLPGRIVKWYVMEGDVLRKGDTIVQLAEIKDGYLDPQLLQRTKDQLTAKEASANFYKIKAEASDGQIGALQESLRLKLKQMSLKVVSDSMDMVAAFNDYKIADYQYKRMQIMRDSGLVSLLQLEQRNQVLQYAMAKKLGAEVKLTNARTELSQVTQDYSEKMYKAQGDRAGAFSEIANVNSEIAKLNNQYANYVIRNGMYFLLSPQDGQIVRAAKSGINEIIKEGDKIADIVPLKSDHAVEMFVRPVDMPLLKHGQDVRFLFDGFPAIVFSGWPNASYGTFSGKIVAIENTVGADGKFRILVAEDTSYKPWPDVLKQGTGANAIQLLNNVPIWYELWRNVNGFPPDFYNGKIIAKDGKHNK